MPPLAHVSPRPRERQGEPAPQTPPPAATRRRAALEEVRKAAPRIRARARLRHLERRFPTEDLQFLREAGVFAAFSEPDGDGLLFEVLRELGRADLSLGRVFEGHVNAALLIRRYGGADGLEALAAGEVLGVWNTEPKDRPVAVDADAVLTGAKSFATGAGHIDGAIITAAAPGGRQMVLVDASDAARVDEGAWRVSGMRGTCSGRYDLQGLPASASRLIGAPDDYLREPMFSAGAWRFCCVQLGGAEHVLLRLREVMAGRETNDPIALARFAEALAAVRSACLWVREAALRAERPDADEDAVAFVLLTRRVVETAALQVLEAASRNVGTQAFFEDQDLDHVIRDLSLYLRQPAPDQALRRAAEAFLERDRWAGDPLW